MRCVGMGVVMSKYRYDFDVIQILSSTFPLSGKRTVAKTYPCLPRGHRPYGEAHNHTLPY
jgi:hypothetical protein